MKSLGFIEIPSVTAAVDALDIMCKTADVEFVTWERKLGGRLVTIIIQGDVSAVKEAVEVAASKSMKACVHAVIPNPHEETMRMVKLSASRMYGNEPVDLMED
ncbi:MAG: microcompartment protein [Herbinix sp.]|jgi:microcompartment protein CcmL/EutN|nr:microcompartment protein [Herbinix sp.]